MEEVALSPVFVAVELESVLLDIFSPLAKE
jgi:hypothetical protein